MKGNISLLWFVLQVVSVNRPKEVSIVIQYLKILRKYIIERSYMIVALPQNVICDISKGQSPYRNYILITRKPLCSSEVLLAAFSSKTKSVSRVILNKTCSCVPANVLLCSEEFLFNIKQALGIRPYSLKTLLFKYSPAEGDEIQNARSATISLLKASETIHVTPLEESSTIENFLLEPVYLHQGDVFSVDLSRCSLLKLPKVQYYELASITGSEPTTKGVLSRYTSIHHKNENKSFKPGTGWICDNNLLPFCPLGLQKYQETLLKWFYPFYEGFKTGLQPVFAVTGPSGVGKRLIVESVALKMGMKYRKIESNSIVTTTTASSHVFNMLRPFTESCPVILHLRDMQLLSKQVDGYELEELVASLAASIQTFKPINPVIFVLSCPERNDLPPKLTEITLRQLEMEPPNVQEKKDILPWISVKYLIPLEKPLRDLIAEETPNFVLSDLIRVVHLSRKISWEENRPKIEEKDVRQVLDEICTLAKYSKDVTWDDIGGLENLKRTIVSSILSSKIMPGMHRKGLLLHGPPGTGKTLLAKAVAAQCSRAFISVKGPELLNKYVGQSEANVRQVFKQAREASPCILFFDELDSLAPNRGRYADSSRATDMVVSQLLSEMDGIDSSGDIFILGATNRPDLLDEALLRPGRFDKLLFVGPCEDPDSKVKVFYALTRKFTMDQVNASEIIEKLPSTISGAQMYSICSSAWMNAAKELISDGKTHTENKVVVKQSHFHKALSSIKFAE